MPTVVSKQKITHYIHVLVNTDKHSTGASRNICELIKDILIIKSKAISGPPCRARCDENDSVNQSARRADCRPHKQTVRSFYL